MVIYGSYSDEFTWAGLGLQMATGFTNADFICDVRDFTADVTVNRDITSLAWWGTIALDVVAFVPVIGMVKYADDVVYGVKMLFKNGDEVIDGGKRLAKAADALGDISKKGGTLLDGMADSLRAMAIKNMKNVDILNDVKYVDDLAGAASDVGKKLDDLADAASDAGKRLDDVVGDCIDVDLTIMSRNSSRGNPSAIMHFDIELNTRQKNLLHQLPSCDSLVVVNKGDVNLNDLAALTAETGDEFAMFTRGSQRMIIRGNPSAVNINGSMAQELYNAGYKWSGHTHPGTGINVKFASEGDMYILEQFNQAQSVILDSQGNFNIFEIGE